MRPLLSLDGRVGREGSLSRKLYFVSANCKRKSQGNRQNVEEGVFNDEVQQNEATQLTDQEIALDASSDGSLSSGEQRRDYMMSSGAEDDQTGEGGSMSHGYTYY
ncbi:hypothetical protein Tco_0695425 [Tanacetum coccineum]